MDIDYTKLCRETQYVRRQADDPSFYLYGSWDKFVDISGIVTDSKRGNMWEQRWRLRHGWTKRSSMGDGVDKYSKTIEIKTCCLYFAKNKTSAQFKELQPFVPVDYYILGVLDADCELHVYRMSFDELWKHVNKKNTTHTESKHCTWNVHQSWKRTLSKYEVDNTTFLEAPTEYDGDIDCPFKKIAVSDLVSVK